MRKLLKGLALIGLLAALLTGCLHKETKEEPVVEKPQPEKRGEADDMLAVYNRLIEGIRRADLDKILSCYSSEGSYGYSDRIKKRFTCFDDNYEVFGIANIESQYRYLFKNRLLDRIEFDVRKVDESELSITFINAWARADYRVAETIYFQRIDDKYYIKRHITHPYE